MSRRGIALVSFAGILKHGLFPLPEILDCIQERGEDALARPVEIEFAVRVSRDPEQPPISDSCKCVRWCSRASRKTCAWKMSRTSASSAAAQGDGQRTHLRPA